MRASSATLGFQQRLLNVKQLARANSYVSIRLQRPQACPVTSWDRRSCSAVASSSVAYEAPPQAQELPRQRVFTHFSVYKQKGAVQASVISPSWKNFGQGSLALDRQGTLFLEFAEAQQGTGSAPGQRRYNWEQKQTFAMSAVELSHIIEPDASGMKPLVHDPNMGGNAAGNVMKTLSILRQQDNESWFLRLTTKIGQQNSSLGVNLSKQEFCTLQTLAKYAVPHLLGFDLALSSNGTFPAPEQNGAPF